MVAGHVQYQLLCHNWNRSSTLLCLRNCKFSVSGMEFKMTVQDGAGGVLMKQTTEGVL